MTTRPVLYAVLTLFAINILNFYDRNLAGALVEPVRKEFGLSDTQIGLLGSAFIWVYAVIGVPLGLVADRWSRRRLLVCGVVLWTSMTALGGLATGFTFLLVTRLGVGIGEAVCAPVGTSWLGDLFPPQRRLQIGPTPGRHVMAEDALEARGVVGVREVAGARQVEVVEA